MRLRRRSDPTAPTDRIPVVGEVRALPAPRRPRTLRLPRVRQAILRDPVDRVAADALDMLLLTRRDTSWGALAITDALLAGRLVPSVLREVVESTVAGALLAKHEQLRPIASRADAWLAASQRCPHCTADELCAGHQRVLWRWWDIRDQAAVDVVNIAVAALAVPASARPRRRR